MPDLPLPGTIGLTQISGQVGIAIRIGQWLVAKLSIDRTATLLRNQGLLAGTEDDDWADYQHAFVYLGDGKLIEAEPGGARIADVSEYTTGGKTVYWCGNIAAEYTETQLQAVANYAEALQGTPYSFLDYFAIAAHALHLPVPLLKWYIGRTKHLICSQLCDYAYEEAGLHLFNDGRWPGFVDPLDLYLLDKQLA